MSDFIKLQEVYRTDSLISALHRALENQGPPNGRHLSKEEATVVAVNSLEECANMDGFWSFFAHRQEWVPVILSALAEIGADDAAQLTKEALELPGVRDLFSTENAGAREPDMITQNALSEIDQRYQERRIAMDEKLWTYVKNHRDAFTLPENSDIPVEKPQGIIGRLFGALRKIKQ